MLLFLCSPFPFTGPTMEPITIIGGGLAGCEAAYQCAERGLDVMLYDMKPVKFSPAHESQDLAELVCSNSFRSDDPNSAVGLLKEEMRMMNSLLMKVAEATKVPAGSALAVDRSKFAKNITEIITAHPRITIIREEISKLPQSGLTILASGPLSSEPLTADLLVHTGEAHLAFYDAIAPIVAAESLNHDIIFSASRWQEGPGDYLNCPMDEAQYKRFSKALLEGDKVPLKEFEKKKYFEGCLPIEVMNERGEDTLRFGPMKPVGLTVPHTGKEAYAVVQLRKEDLQGNHYNMVGFQTKLTYAAQKEIFRTIPGMENCEFMRLGSIHRNTFVCGPKVLEPSLQMKKQPHIFLAGQISGVEGYVESTAIGLLAGRNASAMAHGKEIMPPPPDTAHGALIHHLTTEVKRFQPSNVNYSLFPPFDKLGYKASIPEAEREQHKKGKGKRKRWRISKRDKMQYRSTMARQSLANWLDQQQ